MAAIRSSGAAVAAGRREVAGRLIAPRAVERMLGQRQQLDVGEAQVGGVRRQLAGGRPVAEKAAVRRPPPGAQMHLVDAHRPVRRLAIGAAAHPGAVAPASGGPGTSASGAAGSTNAVANGSARDSRRPRAPVHREPVRPDPAAPRVSARSRSRRGPAAASCRAAPPRPPPGPRGPPAPRPRKCNPKRPGGRRAGDTGAVAAGGERPNSAWLRALTESPGVQAV